MGRLAHRSRAAHKSAALTTVEASACLTRTYARLYTAKICRRMFDLRAAFWASRIVRFSCRDAARFCGRIGRGFFVQISAHDTEAILSCPVVESDTGYDKVYGLEFINLRH